jgi:excisionase family DNA binding protein
MTELTIADITGKATIAVPEAGQVLGLGRDAAYAAAARGEIPVLRLGRSLRVPVPKLLQMLGAHPETGPQDSEAGARTPANASTSTTSTPPSDRSYRHGSG